MALRPRATETCKSPIVCPACTADHGFSPLAQQEEVSCLHLHCTICRPQLFPPHATDGKSASISTAHVAAHSFFTLVQQMIFHPHATAYCKSATISTTHPADHSVFALAQQVLFHLAQQENVTCKSPSISTTLATDHKFYTLMQQERVIT
ncbi:hypothetical protein B0H13DRAFT_2336552 [Mycena leptocephala]|nr:hypothetical protein B0H13DRAFT_2336552 [Mycena leptocephala]